MKKTDSRPEGADLAAAAAGPGPVRAPDAEAPSDEAAVMLAELKAELDEAIEARKRALADFANYQRRALENEHRAARGAATDVIRSLLGVLDHFDLALGQEKATAEQLLRGVRMVRDELGRVLEGHGVRRIEPKVGAEFDPLLHQAVMRRPSQDVPPDHIVSVLQAGYAQDDVVLRPARVAVAAPGEQGQ